MKKRNLLMLFYVMGFGFFMMLFGYWGRYEYLGGIEMIFLGLFASCVAYAGFWAIWNLNVSRRNAHEFEESKGKSTEKRKREHIDSVLRDLSDEDLLRLRRRLLDGTLNHDTLEKAFVGEDGELLNGEYR